METKTYESLAQCAGTEQIPETLLKAVKVSGAPGFRGSRIDWHILKPWLDANQETIDDLANNSLQEIKRRNLIADGVLKEKEKVLKDLEIAKKRGEQLDPKEVSEFMSGLGTTLSVTLKKIHRSLRSKCPGHEVAIDNEFADAYDVIRKELTKWSKK